MQYWINHDGVQTGPVEREQLKDMALTSRAYVWHEGLEDWVKNHAIARNWRVLYQHVTTGDQPATAQQADPQPEAPAVEGEPLPADEQAAADEVPPIPEAVVGQPYQPGYQQSPYQPGYQQPYQRQYQQYGYQQPQQQQGEPCPPTNLVWAILATVLCCLPAGVVAIVYAVKVSRRYQMGDIQGAKRASETGAWWCIASIILGIISQPLAMLMMMGGSGAV